MNFKIWLYEWEGSNFAQEPDLVNSAQYPNSKYKGKGDNEEGERADLPGDFSKINKNFGFKSGDDPLLKIQRLMKKMKKLMHK